MSVSTRKRLYLTVAALVVATAALANNPSPRTESRMVYDPTTATSILFGGRSATDYGTAVAYYSNETWIWNGARWSQRFPAHAPGPRSAQSMVFDTLRSRIVLFGGRSSDTNVLGDTWIYHDGDWQQLSPPSSPPGRQSAGMVYDPVRDRVVLFGGSQLAADGVNYEPRRDMWEFDGTTWREVMAQGPNVIKPQLVFDKGRNQIVMLGIDAEAKTLMYAYDPATVTWSEVKPKELPPCANESQLVYMEKDGLIALIGGVCGGIYDLSYYYDGTSWYGFSANTGIGHVYGHALTYDVRRDQIVLFGGAEGVLAPRSLTFTYNAGDWRVERELALPVPRAMPAFAADPINKAIWLFGGLNEYQDAYYDDFWRYQNGHWARMQFENQPVGCGSVSSAVDTDRGKLVLLCNGNNIFEFDLKDQTWKSFANLTNPPEARRQAHLVYDPVQKKTVMYGGFDALNYRNDTWLWDGAAWTEVKKARADARSGAAMWFDPTLKKVVLYGGIGRPEPENTIRRYSDMWSFDAANGWKKMDIKSTPGERYNAQVLVDPRTNKVMLYGGVRVDQIDDKTRKQVFANDLWEWNGTAWTRVGTIDLPGARQSFGLAHDPYADRIVIFAGYNGLFQSDVWTSQDWKTWVPREEALGRRRVVRR